MLTKKASFFCFFPALGNANDTRKPLRAFLNGSLLLCISEYSQSSMPLEDWRPGV